MNDLLWSEVNDDERLIYEVVLIEIYLMLWMVELWLYRVQVFSVMTWYRCMTWYDYKIAINYLVFLSVIYEQNVMM